MALLDDDPTAGSGFGGAFGGAGNSLLTPFIGQQGMNDARANALMNIGAAMMQASAPSLDPSHRSLGYALGQGLVAGQNAYQGGMDRGIRNAAAAQQLAAQRYALMQRIALMNRFAQKYGMQTIDPSAASAGVPSLAAPAAAGAGAAAAGAGGSAAPITNGSNSTTAMPASAPGGVMDREDLMLLSLSDPSNARGYADVFSKVGPRLERLPNGVIVDMNDPRNLGMVTPAVGEGRLPNGTWLPAYLQGTEQKELADKAVSGLFEDVNGMTPGGATYAQPRTTALINAGILPPNIVPGVNAGGANTASFPSAPGTPQLPAGARQTGISVQEKGRLEGDQSTFNEAKKTALQAAQAAQNTIDRLSANRALIEQSNLGKGAPQWNVFAQWLQQAGLLSADQAQKVASSQMLSNNLRQAVLENLKSTFPGRISNAEMNAMAAAMGDTSNPLEVARYMNDMMIAKTNRVRAFGSFMQGYRGDPGAYLDAWQQSPEGSRSLLEDPAMLRHMTIKQNAKGQYGAFIPTDHGMKVLLVQPDGQGGWMPAVQ